MGSTTRITGMYSGMDTEALVEEMLAANKTPLNNFQKELTEVEWQRESLLDLNKELLELQNLSGKMQKEDAKVQDAHEAIRPTRVDIVPETINNKLNKNTAPLLKYELAPNN